MKKSDRNLLLAAGAAGAIAFVAFRKKEPGAVSGIPGVGAVLPNNSLVPEKWRGQCSPAWLDAALWGSGGMLVGYSLLAGKKLF